MGRCSRRGGPSRDELAGLAGVVVPTPEPSDTPTLSTELIAELAAVGAAVGSNCEPCFRFHYNAGRKLGLSNEQLAVAVRTAQQVKDAPAGNMLDLAAKLLHVDRSALGGVAAVDADADGGACCGPDAADATELPMAGAGATSESGGCC